MDGRNAPKEGPGARSGSNGVNGGVNGGVKVTPTGPRKFSVRQLPSQLGEIEISPSQLAVQGQALAGGGEGGEPSDARDALALDFLLRP